MAAEIEMGFKVTYKNEKRRFPAQADVDINSVLAQIRKVYAIPSERDISLRYEDDDGDLVTFSTTEELHEGMRLAKQSESHTLLIDVADVYESGSASERSVESEPMKEAHVAPLSSSSSDWRNRRPEEIRQQKKMWRQEQRNERKCIKHDFREQKRQLHQMRKREKYEEKFIAKDKEFAARFVAHVSIPDMACISKGQKFTKTWRFRNEGTQVWPADTQLLFISKEMGDIMGAPLSVAIPRAVLPREEVDISVDFVAPMQIGQYCGYWRLALANGRKFGQRVWCRIQVVEGGSNW